MLRISIIIPIFKVKDYIGRCIYSVIEQECSNFDLECILVNDCSPDDSMEIVHSILEKYTGNIIFKIINHEKNRGLSAARNTGLHYANGDYVFFVDSDDKLNSNAINTLLNGMNSISDNNIDVIMGNAFICKNNKAAMTFKVETPLLFSNNDETALRKLLNRELFHTAWNKLVRREFLIKKEISFEEGILDEDLLWSYYVFVNAKSVLINPRVTYIYEDNPSSIMNTASEKVAQIIKSRIIICNRILAAPPCRSIIDYYNYIFYILIRAINLYEDNKLDSAIIQLKEELFGLRDLVLMHVRKKRLFLLYLFFLTSKKPFLYLLKMRLYRRYYDVISKLVVACCRFFYVVQ